MPADARQLLSQLGALAHRQPAPADAAAALDSTRTALLARRSRRRWLRLSIPSGIAACLLAAALLAFVMQASPTAHAAEHFQQAVQSAQNYQGWVQLVATPRNAITVPGRGKLLRITCRRSAAEGLYGEVRQYQDATDLTFCSLKQNTVMTYAGGSDQIRLRTLAKDDDDDQPRDLLLPASLGDTLTRVKATLGREPAARPTRDGNDLRIDVTLFGSHEDEREFHRRNASTRATPAAFSVWINPQNVITRLSCESMGGTLDSTVTYNAAPVASIYDLGAPRSAPVIETRSRERENDHD